MINVAGVTHTGDERCKGYEGDRILLTWLHVVISAMPLGNRHVSDCLKPNARGASSHACSGRDDSFRLLAPRSTGQKEAGKVVRAWR